MPKMIPKARARTAAIAAAFKVPSTPGMMCLVQMSACRNGFHFCAAHWFFWPSFHTTRAATAAKAAVNTTVSRRSRRRAALSHPAEDQARREGEHDEKQGIPGEDRDHDIAVALELVAHRVEGLGNADRGGDRGVFDQGDEYAAEGPDDRAECLRQHDHPHCLDEAQPDGACRFGLAERNGVDPGPQHLTD